VAAVAMREKGCVELSWYLLLFPDKKDDVVAAVAEDIVFEE